MSRRHVQNCKRQCQEFIFTENSYCKPTNWIKQCYRFYSWSAYFPEYLKMCTSLSIKVNKILQYFMNNKNVASSLTVIIIINVYVKKLAKTLFGHEERFIKFVYQCLRYFVIYAITYRYWPVLKNLSLWREKGMIKSLYVKFQSSVLLLFDV